MKQKQKDALVYLLFAVILLLFAVLFFFYFRTGDTATIERTETIPAEVTSITVRSNYSNIRLLPSEDGVPRVTYSRRAAEGNADEVRLSQTGREYLIEVRRRSDNPLSGLWRRAAPITLYLPRNHLLKCNIRLTAGAVRAEQTELRTLSVHAIAADVTLDQARLDRATVVGKAGRLTTNDCAISRMDVKLNLADLLLSGTAAADGFTLDASVSLGLLDTAAALGLEHPRFAVRYNETLTCLGAAEKIHLNVNIARLRVVD